MKYITLRITPECRSRWAWAATMRWCAAAAFAKVACWLIDVSVILSDDYEIEVHTSRKEVCE